MAGKFAKRREKLFKDYGGRLAAAGGQTDSFQCPICLKSFDRDALIGERLQLTLAHVLPKALGGTLCALACAGCNNDIGSNLEAFLLERFRVEDAFDGKGTVAGRLVVDSGSVGVEVQAASPDQPWKVLIIEEQTNPVVLQKLYDALNAPTEDGLAQVASSIKLRFRNRPKRVSAALYQSAYLLMFAYFGYEFLRDERYGKLREQILKPDEDILPASFDVPPTEWADLMIPAAQPHGVVFVKEPYPYIMPVFRLSPIGGADRVVGVPLPSLGDPSWPTPGPKGKVKGVIVRFRSENDNGVRPGFRDLWELANVM